MEIKNYSVLLFDLDGTIVDTDFANYLAYRKAIIAVFPFSKVISFEKEKRFNRSALKEMLPRMTNSQYLEIVLRKDIFYKECLKHTKINKPIVEILDKFYKVNKTVLVTNCRENRAILTLNFHDLFKKFHTRFYRQDTLDIKINKFEYALNNLKISPIDVVVFENEESEITDAIKVGILESNICNVKL